MCTWASPKGPTWVPVAPHLGPIWAAHLGLGTGAAHVGPTWVPYGCTHGQPIWDPHGTLLHSPPGSHIGSPSGTHEGAHMGPIWVPYRLLAGILEGRLNTINLQIWLMVNENHGTKVFRIKFY